MIGQKNLLKTLEVYNQSSFPHTCLFIGELGSGRHTIIEQLADKFDLDVQEISENIDSDLLYEFRYYPNKRIYIIDLAKFTRKEQNVFLKFIEEPGENCYICLIAETEVTVLPTIINRCVKFYMEQYSQDELRYFQVFPDPTLYEICNTPGQLKAVNYLQFPEMRTLINKILTALMKASYANTLSIATKINYKEDYDKFDFKLFLKALEFFAYKKYLAENNEACFKIYCTVNTYRKMLIDRNVVKENFMLNLLTVLWQKAHEDNA